MEFTDCVRRDRATRWFSDDPVPDAVVTSIIDLARRAGSAKNSQPWSFVVVRDSHRREKLASFGRYTTPLKRAPVGIVLLVEPRTSSGSVDTAVFDCGRAFQNMKLAATDLGLGAVPQSVDREQAGEFLDVPDGTSVLIACALGYPLEPTDTIEGRDKEDVLEEAGRRDTDELIHWETFG